MSYYKAKLYLKNKFKDKIKCKYISDIIVKPSILGFKEICTDTKLETVSTLSDSNCDRLFIRLINDNISQLELSKYVFDFNYDRFNQILEFDYLYRKKHEKELKKAIRKSQNKVTRENRKRARLMKRWSM